MEAEGVREVRDCVVVGGGPGGAMLALLLARKGVRVTLLEAHDDFDRDFRGDTIHPSVLEIMDELGLAERLHQLPHSKISTATIVTDRGPTQLADFRRLRTRFPYIMMLPQKDFLAFVVAEARRYDCFELLMGARVEGLIEEGGRVRGVRYEAGGAERELRAALTVGADGRGSRLRHLGGFELLKTSPPMDVLWFRVPRLASDPKGGVAYFRGGRGIVMLERGEQWQVAHLIQKGGFGEIRAAGMPALRERLKATAPEYAERFDTLTGWKQISVLAVESSRVTRWHRPGLLLIGDAAHVMSPVGGVGINYAIQDAVEAANVLAEPLKAGTLRDSDLRAVQRRREWPTRLIQALQTRIQKRVIAAALDPRKAFRVPAVLRLILSLPLLRTLPARVVGLGFKRVHVKP
ncbi:MAG TPA: FAD-dependent oxidoreductase [Pyrinomonadaceae bacterium]|jgi:2-polyprenyl-6-methoxyphenol hydroxylase-like FAD-dependent oxidoreductase